MKIKSSVILLYIFLFVFFLRNHIICTKNNIRLLVIYKIEANIIHFISFALKHLDFIYKNKDIKNR